MQAEAAAEAEKAEADGCAKAKEEAAAKKKAEEEAGKNPVPSASCAASTSDVAAEPLSVKDQHKFCDECKQRDFDAVKKMLDADPRYVNVQPGGRWSALHQFAQAGNEAAVKYLLAKGASLTAKTGDGKTPAEVLYSRLPHANTID